MTIRDEIEEMFAELSYYDGAIAKYEAGMRLLKMRWDRSPRLAKESHSPKPRGGARPHPPHALRAEALLMMACGTSLRATARQLGVSKASLCRWKKVSS